jgi:hypothetical protein
MRLEVQIPGGGELIAPSIKKLVDLLVNNRDVFRKDALILVTVDNDKQFTINPELLTMNPSILVKQINEVLN